MSPIARTFAGLLLGIALVIPSLARAQETAPVDAASFTGTIKLACVGDSITQGVGAAAGQSWPDQIRTMLGTKWEVRNFGVSGSTLLNAGDKPYQKEGAFAKAREFLPDVVVIILGTNDTKPQNWKHKDSFAADYRDLIGKFAGLPSKPRIYICYPPYIAGDGSWGINEANTQAEIPIIDAVAKEAKVGVIDVHAALVGKDALIPDKVHPNTQGATEIAKAVYRGLTAAR
jgi:lysophospholipase L1-like esterase